MTTIATPSPPGSSVVGGRDRAGRALRVTAHPEAGRVVVSTWQGGTCVATVRLAGLDVPELVAALASAAIACAAEGGGDGVPAPPRPTGRPPRPGDRSGAASGASAA